MRLLARENAFGEREENAFGEREEKRLRHSPSALAFAEGGLCSPSARGTRRFSSLSRESALLASPDLSSRDRLRRAKAVSRREIRCTAFGEEGAQAVSRREIRCAEMRTAREAPSLSAHRLRRVSRRTAFAESLGAPPSPSLSAHRLRRVSRRRRCTGARKKQL